jgi:Reversibly glycosylated polypeptide
MTKPKMTLVITTINVPHLLTEYADNFAAHGHLDAVDVIVVGDRKTPHAEAAALAGALTNRGFRTEYMDLPAQQAYMKRFPELDALIPYDSDQRRNIGYLKAAEQGADILVAVDDDNYVKDDDWYTAHTVVGKTVTLPTASSATKWWSPCRMMDTDPPRRLFPRGHPYGKRHLPDDEMRTATTGRVVLNGGLWLLEPDVDSLTRLTEPVRCTRLNESRVMLAPGTWAAINTQNTAFHRETLPAFYFVPISAFIGGIVVERYGDIWAGLFCRKAIDHLNDRVTYGIPACDHKRNAHVLLKDMQLEFWSILITEELWQTLYDWKLTAATYADTYDEIADRLAATTWKTLPLAGEVQKYFQRMAAAMKVWTKTVRLLGF